MTPRKETEPTKECMEAAISLDAFIRAHDHLTPIAAISIWLTRRDEARDAALLKPWREAADGIDDAFEDWRHTYKTAREAFVEIEKHLDALDAIASPSPASSEPCDGEKL